MALYNYLPFIGDELVEQSLEFRASSGEQKIPRGYDVEYVMGRRSPREKLLGISLCLDPQRHRRLMQLPSVNEEDLRSSVDAGTSFWEDHVFPLLTFGPVLRKFSPETVLRIYLAKNLEFLADKLVGIFEIFVMRDSCVGEYSGSLWSNLGIEDHPGSYTQICAQYFPSAMDKMAVTRAVIDDGLGSWRIPVLPDVVNGRIHYAPMDKSFWGTSMRLPIKDLLGAFHWALENKKISLEGRLPSGGRTLAMLIHSWEEERIGEFFLSSCLFPRLAEGGIFTALPESNISSFLPFDIEFCTWMKKESVCSYDVNHLLAKSGRGSILTALLAGSSKREGALPFYRSQVPAHF